MHPLWLTLMFDSFSSKSIVFLLMNNKFERLRELLDSCTNTLIQ